MVTLFEDIEVALLDSGLVLPDNFQWLESQDKLALADSQFPRMEINLVGEDSIERVDQNKLYLSARFILGFYFRWVDEIDTPAKAKTRLFYIEGQKTLMRRAIYLMEVKKQRNELTCPQFEEIDPLYNIDVIHEFIPKHSIISFDFGIHLTENPFY